MKFNFTEFERERYLKEFKALNETTTNIVHNLELEDDVKFTVEFILFAMLGGSLVNELQSRLKREIENQTINKEEKTV